MYGVMSGGGGEEKRGTVDCAKAQCLLASPNTQLAEECSSSGSKAGSRSRQRGCVRQTRACREGGAANGRERKSERKREDAAPDRQQRSNRASRQRGTVLSPTAFCFFPCGAWRVHGGNESARVPLASTVVECSRAALPPRSCSLRRVRAAAPVRLSGSTPS